MSRAKRVFGLGIVIAVAALLLSFLAPIPTSWNEDWVVPLAYAQQPRMPDVSGYTTSAEDEGLGSCPDGTILRWVGYNDANSVEAPLYRALRFYLRDSGPRQNVPFAMVVNDNPWDFATGFDVYVDWNRDGFVDMRARGGDARIGDNPCFLVDKVKNSR